MRPMTSPVSEQLNVLAHHRATVTISRAAGQTHRVPPYPPAEAIFAFTGQITVPQHRKFRAALLEYESRATPTGPQQLVEAWTPPAGLPIDQQLLDCQTIAGPSCQSHG
jgi:hypothetical protein